LVNAARVVVHVNRDIGHVADGTVIQRTIGASAAGGHLSAANPRAQKGRPGHCCNPLKKFSFHKIFLSWLTGRQL
jgi:hypothetical protein